MDVKLVGFNPQKILHETVDNDKVKTYLANTVKRYMDKYVPMDTGMLMTDVTVEPTKITYNVPYAAYQFYGDGFNFNHEHHPLAQAHWDRPVEQAYSKQIASEIQDYIRRE